MRQIVYKVWRQSSWMSGLNGWNSGVVLDDDVIDVTWLGRFRSPWDVSVGDDVGGDRETGALRWWSAAVTGAV